MNIPPQVAEAMKEEMLKELGWGPTVKKALKIMNEIFGPASPNDEPMAVGRVDKILPSEAKHVVIVKKNDYDDFSRKYYAHWRLYLLSEPLHLVDAEDRNEHVHWSSEWRYKIYRVTETLSEVQVPCVCCGLVVAQAHSMERPEFDFIMGMTALAQAPALQHAFTLAEDPNLVYVFSNIHMQICKKCHGPVCCDMVCELAHHRKCELVPAMEDISSGVYSRDADADKEMQWIQQFGEYVE